MEAAGGQGCCWINIQSSYHERPSMWVPSLGQENPLEKGMAIPSSIFAWRFPGTEELGELQSIASQKIWTQLT